MGFWDLFRRDPAPAGRQAFNRPKLKHSITLGEGERLRPYTCTAGKLTIGIGRNLEDVGISKAEAQMLLEADIDRAVDALDHSLKWWRSLDDVRQRVLIEMCFNMGIGSATRGLMSFVNTLEAIRTGRYDDAATGMLASKWAGQVGHRAERLARMMRTGSDLI